MLNRGLFSSVSEHWATPKELHAALDAEFRFNDDPCPLFNKSDINGLYREWGTSTYVNPPYGRELGAWMAKAMMESRRGKLVVCLIPSRTDTKWWHDYVMQADEIRFCRGRLCYGDKGKPAPFPSAIIVFRGKDA